MGDVRRYIVCFGLETILRELCNTNQLRVCDENGADVMLGDDDFYESVVQDSPSGKKFAEQRDSWKEGTDFNFVALFYAQKDEVDVEEPRKIEDSSVVDTEVIS